MSLVSKYFNSGSHFLKELDFTDTQWRNYLHLAAELKRQKREGREIKYLQGKNIALLFEKSSTRTRCAFEVAAADQGAHTVYLDPEHSQMGHKESIEDTAAVLGRMFDGIEYRGDEHAKLETLAAHSGVPVFNGLTDDWHPTQTLADSLTMLEHAGGRDFSEISYTYVGDARFNMGRSLLVNGAMLGADVRIVAPRELWPDKDVIAAAQARAAVSGARVTVTDEISAVEGTDFICTDIWVSMGEPVDVWEERIALLQPYRVDQKLMDLAGEGAKFMHCLPAYHDLKTKVGHEVYEKFGLDGVEVTDEVFSSPASIVFDEAENRLHTIKAVMVASLGMLEGEGCGCGSAGGGADSSGSSGVGAGGARASSGSGFAGAGSDIGVSRDFKVLGVANPRDAAGGVGGSGAGSGVGAGEANASGATGAEG